MAATKTSATLYTLAETAINTISVGSAFSVPSGAVEAAIAISVAQVTTTTPAGGLTVILQGNPETSGNAEKWEDISSFYLLGVTAAATTTTSAGITGGSTTSVATVGSATFGARTSYLYLRDSGTVGEWIRSLSHVSTTLTFSEACALSHTSGISMYSQASTQFYNISVGSYNRLRLIIDNNTQATGPTYAVQGLIVTTIP